MFSLEQLWINLSTETIGFYTYRRRNQIPERPGVYAWFLPFNLQGSHEDLLGNARRTFVFDSPSEGQATWKDDKAGFKWDPLCVEITRRDKVLIPEAIKKLLPELKEAPDEIRNRFRLALLASSIFAKPLYVGLSNNLSHRYGDHITGKSGFRERFTKYMQTLKQQITVQDLLFVCIPLAPVQTENEEWFDACQSQVLECMLKILCQPAFGEK
jgi:hypothetical protein